MKEMVEKMWEEYFAEECSAISTTEERELIRRADELHKTAGKMLSEKQNEAVERYIEVLYDIEALCIKKAFFKGCGFATSLFLKLNET